MDNKNGQERPEHRGERRSSSRVATVFRPVLIETGQLASFCLVRNLSPLGLMAKVYNHLPHGATISVRFNANLTVEGVVVWSSKGHAGVRFNQPIDVDNVLSDLNRTLPDGKVNRALRLQIKCQAELAIGDRTLAIELHDISQRGIKACASYVRPGDEVQVRLPGLEPRKAVVRWTQPKLAGLNFLRPFAFEELAQWVVKQQSRNSGSSSSRLLVG